MRIFSKEKIVDEPFGPLTVSHDEDLQLFYFEKEINFNHFKKITLYLEGTQKRISSKQISLYALIKDNSQYILNATKEFYYDHYKVDIYNDYYIESISINDLENNYNWELKF